VAVNAGHCPKIADGKLQDLIDVQNAHVNTKFEHPFRVIKQLFGFQKTSLRGLNKKTCKINVLAALTNLFLARPQMLATV
jgi:IS5 family transposase